MNRSILRTAVSSIPLALVLSLAAAAPTTAQEQSADEKEVVSVIERFFAGMLARDTAMMNSTVDPAARLIRVSRPQGGAPVVSTSPMSGFIARVGSGQGEGANERIYDPEVRIDDNMASVWVYFTLHVGDRFSHCGYDSFQLLRLPDGWKIVNVADTGRTEGCEVR